MRPGHQHSQPGTCAHTSAPGAYSGSRGGRATGGAAAPGSCTAAGLAGPAPASPAAPASPSLESVVSAAAAAVAGGGDAARGGRLGVAPSLY